MRSRSQIILVVVKQQTAKKLGHLAVLLLQLLIASEIAIAKYRISNRTAILRSIAAFRYNSALKDSNPAIKTIRFMPKSRSLFLMSILSRNLFDATI